MGHSGIHSVLSRSVAAREMVLLIEAVTSAFKMSVWGGHPRGRQRVTLCLCVVFPLCMPGQLALKLLESSSRCLIHPCGTAGTCCYTQLLCW